MMDERGRILNQEKFPNERLEFERIFKGIDDANVAMEACYCWQPPYEFLESRGYNVKLAHPTKTRIIAEARIKTDATDSEALAHLLRADLLPTSYVPPKEFRELRELVRLCTYLMRERTRFKNTYVNSPPWILGGEFFAYTYPRSRAAIWQMRLGTSIKITRSRSQFLNRGCPLPL
jgi:transposase